MSEIKQIPSVDDLEDRAILDCIHAFVAEEHRLRGLIERGEITQDASTSRLQEIEGNLDHLWDLLRHRREERNLALASAHAAKG